MEMLRTWVLGLLSLVVTSIMGADYTIDGQYVTIPVKQVKAEGAKVVRLQVVNDHIIRVQATSENQLPEKQSLIIVPQTSKPKFTVTDGDVVSVKAAHVEARVNKETGAVMFFDAHGKLLLKEAKRGKTFKPFRVPDREIGTDVAKVPEEQRNGLTWRMLFESPRDEAFYGLGQHQSEELNMKGLNEDLFQYNTKVSVPFILSNKNYGLLWDSYSYCRWGNPDDYLQLGHAFKLYDKQGREGHLTGIYTDKNGQRLVRNEDSIYYEFDTPVASEIANRTEPGGIKNLPKGFQLNGSKVVYEGFIEAPKDAQYHFILYYAGYIKVYIGGKEVVPERWRTAWNPNTYKFRKRLPKGKRQQLRIEWQPDGDVSYCGLRVAKLNKDQRRLSVWSRIWTIISLQVRMPTRLSVAIVPSRARLPSIPSGCWASGRVVSAIRLPTKSSAPCLSFASDRFPAITSCKTGTIGKKISGALISLRRHASPIRRLCSTVSIRWVAVS